MTYVLSEVLTTASDLQPAEATEDGDPQTAAASNQQFLNNFALEVAEIIATSPKEGVGTQ